VTRHRILWLAGATALTGSVLLGWPRAHPRPPAPLPSPAATGQATVLPGPPASSPQAVPRTVPARLVIPAIGLSAAVVPEGLDSSGALEVPPLTAGNLAGWWAGGAAPGQDGPAVIAGHVDSAQAGPLVFWRLRLLKPGDIAETEPGGLRFVVTKVAEVGKLAFPTLAVYGPTPGPELRLVTCGGSFDAASGHYADNVIVYAREAA
jgi:Sortase domain